MVHMGAAGGSARGEIFLRASGAACGGWLSSGRSI
tara:strand:- start:8745 stop:8849 length:105 start_codon:yes stop_codon:yes gene_type:complete